MERTERQGIAGLPLLLQWRELPLVQVNCRFTHAFEPFAKEIQFIF